MTAATLPTPLIDAATLAALLALPPDDPARPLVFDCHFDLADAGAGERAYEAGHIPGAQYLHLERTLSGAKTGPDGFRGRHPLPAREAFAQALAARGVGATSPVVVYDANGAMMAGRAWWMLRWLGHEAVAVLDGGLPAWRAAGGALQTGAVAARPAAPGQGIVPRPAQVATVDHAALRQGLGRDGRQVVDARAPDRFRGENETLDAVGGHIPGALNRFFRDNLQADGRFKPAAQLRAEWQALLAGREAAQVVMQCGSGVTACHNLLALAVAGLGDALLYPGSWSEWSAQPGAPVATGA